MEGRKRRLDGVEEEERQARRPCIEVDEEWEVRPGVVSQPLPSLSTARNFHGAAVVTPSNHVFVVAGHGSKGILDSVERLGEDNSAWREEVRLAISIAHSNCRACAVGTAVIVVGGCGRSNHGGYLDDVEAVDTVSGAHTTLPPLPQKLYACGVVSLQGKVIVTGGYDDSAFDTVWALDVGQQQQQQPLQWTSLPSMTKARAFHGAAAGGGCVFVCGGGSRKFPTDSCEMLRVAVAGEEQGEWEALPPMPMGLSSVGCCYGGGNVFVAGGRPSPQRSVFALSVRERKWTQVAELATARFGCAAVCVGRRVMVLGGCDRDNHSGKGNRGPHLKTCEKFEF